MSDKNVRKWAKSHKYCPVGHTLRSRWDATLGDFSADLHVGAVCLNLTTVVPIFGR